jgi:riboflavin synthase
VFTGIVLELGRLSADPAPVAGGGAVLRIGHSPALGARLEIGASLAVAGVCLTLTESEPERSTVELSPETLARTRLGRLTAGAAINLEPALRAGDALGGHWVQGHVDGLVTIAARREQGAHMLMTLDLPPSFDLWVVEKGSVALDGVSLTVAARTQTTFDVALVPHTLAATTLGASQVGEELHFEADILAKYVAHAIAHSAASGTAGR